MMQKKSWAFAVAAQCAPIDVTCWGHYGLPVVLFASAGADSLEADRLLLVASLAPLLEAGRIKLYSIAGTAVRALLGSAPAAQRIHAQCAFDEWVAAGLVPHIRQDCQSDSLELLACGCAFGAASAVKALLHSPQSFRGAIGLSGTYDLMPWITPEAPPVHFSPLQWLGELRHEAQLSRLQQRRVDLACGAGDYEEPAASQALADLLRTRGVATRMDVWGAPFGFGFPSWNQMLPQLLNAWL
jgi:esterase/lipase superfamily enzyme